MIALRSSAIGDRLPHLELVEGRLLVVDRQDGLALGRADHHLEARIVLDLGDAVGIEEREGLDVAGKQRRHGGRGVRNDAELGLVEGHRRAPVIVRFDQRDRRALGPALELERAGADGLFLVGVGGLRRHDHRVAPAHIVEEGALRVLQRHLDRRRVDDLDLVDGREQALLRVDRIVGAGAVEREFHVVGVEVGAVVEFDAGVQLEGVDLAVIGNGPALGEIRQHLAVRADAGQALEHVGVEHFVDRRRGARGRVEMRRFERNADDQVGARGKCRGAGGKRQDRSGKNGFPQFHRATPICSNRVDRSVISRWSKLRFVLPGSARRNVFPVGIA